MVRFDARGSVFLYVRSHAQLQCYLRFGGSQLAANDVAGVPVLPSGTVGKIVHLKPVTPQSLP